MEEIVLKKGNNIICDRSVNVILQKVDIKISKDKNLFIKYSWIGQGFL